jgi:hypothetical protein
LYKWSGALGDAAVVLNVDIGDCKPEELIVTPMNGRTHELELLSDDGDRDVDGKKCKDAKPGKRAFRGMRTSIEL